MTIQTHYSFHSRRGFLYSNQDVFDQGMRISFKAIVNQTVAINEVDEKGQIKKTWHIYKNEYDQYLSAMQKKFHSNAQNMDEIFNQVFASHSNPPKEIKKLIASFLAAEDKARLRRVSKEYKDAIDEVPKNIEDIFTGMAKKNHKRSFLLFLEKKGKVVKQLSISPLILNDNDLLTIVNAAPQLIDLKINAHFLSDRGISYLTNLKLEHIELNVPYVFNQRVDRLSQLIRINKRLSKKSVTTLLNMPYLKDVTFNTPRLEKIFSNK